MAGPAPASVQAGADLEAALQALAVAPWLGEGLCVVAAVALAACLARRPWAALRATAADVPALRATCCALGAAALASTAAALAGPVGLRPAALGRLLPQLALPLVALAARLAGPRAVRRACRAFVVTALMATAYGLGCWASGWSPAVAWPARQAANGQSFVPGTSWPAAGGFLGHRLKQAHLLVLASVPLAVALATGGRRGLALGAPVVGFLLAGLAGTYARAAAVAAGVGACVAAWHVLPPRWAAPASFAATGVVALAAAWAVARPGGAWPMLSALLGAGGEREEIWRQAGVLCRDYPLGLGLGNYPRVVGAYYDLAAPLSQAPRTAPHALLLAALLEGGPVALVATAVAFGTLAARGRAVLREGAPLAARRAGLACVQLVAVLLVAGLGHDVLYHGVVGWAAWAAAGLALAGCAPPPASAEEGARACG